MRRFFAFIAFFAVLDEWARGNTRRENMVRAGTSVWNVYATITFLPIMFIAGGIGYGLMHSFSQNPLLADSAAGFCALGIYRIWVAIWGVIWGIIRR